MLDICSSHTLSISVPPIVTIHKDDVIVLPNGKTTTFPNEIKLDLSNIPSLYHEYILNYYL